MLSGGRDVELVTGPAEDPMMETRHGQPPEYAIKDDHVWLGAHPMLRCHRGSQHGTWRKDQDRGYDASNQDVFALSMFGVAGVHSEKAGKVHVSVTAARAAADNTVEHVVWPIQALGHTVHVFGHTWTALHNGTILHSIEAAYAVAGVRAAIFGRQGD